MKFMTPMEELSNTHIHPNEEVENQELSHLDMEAQVDQIGGHQMV